MHQPHPVPSLLRGTVATSNAAAAAAAAAVASAGAACRGGLRFWVNRHSVVAVAYYRPLEGPVPSLGSRGVRQEATAAVDWGRGASL